MSVVFRTAKKYYTLDLAHTLLKKLKKHHVKEEKKESPEKIPEPSNIKKNGNEMKFSEKKEKYYTLDLAHTPFRVHITSLSY
jgi:hypothetical protein